MFRSIILLCLAFSLWHCSPSKPSAQAESTAPMKVNRDVDEPEDKEQQQPETPFSLDYIRGRFDPATHPDFLEIPEEYADRPGRYMRKDAFASFLRMYKAAQIEGITLKIISAARNFDMQKAIWEAKWTGKRLVEDGQNLAQTTPDAMQRAKIILRFSSMPGTSRHHWGTDIDLNNLENSFFDKGEGLKIYKWLTAHAHEYGYCQPYTAKNDVRPHGYNEEKWHWSFQPIAQKLTAQAKKMLGNAEIEGFLGSNVAPQMGVVEKYVLGINQECNN